MCDRIGGLRNDRYRYLTGTQPEPRLRLCGLRHGFVLRAVLRVPRPRGVKCAGKVKSPHRNPYLDIYNSVNLLRGLSKVLSGLAPSSGACSGGESRRRETETLREGES